ncbi:MAG: type II toxin-antitoxin system RelE/ParE family toxin [Defluviitaleaceae bacterium]|nr:type II toxin-antitoxin system RelE/ParE family toxin [Defluviitaleaceae bacterium]
MTYRVDISSRAEKEMWEIADYISFELDSPKAAYDLLDEMGRQIDGLNLMPKRFALVSDVLLAQKGIRFIPIKNYSVFYVVDEPTKIVTVISVMYSKRKWAVLL